MTELTEIIFQKAKKNKNVSETLKALTGRTIEEQLEELYGQLRSPSLSQIKENVLLPGRT